MRSAEGLAVQRTLLLLVVMMEGWRRAAAQAAAASHCLLTRGTTVALPSQNSTVAPGHSTSDDAHFTAEHL